MSTKSAADFEWCVKLMETLKFNVGIASKQDIKRDYIFEDIFDYDENAILFTSHNGPPVIKIGSKIIHSNLMMEESEHVIRFRFRPKQKKLVIDMVRAGKSIVPPAFFQILFQQGHYEIDLQDNVTYFPFIQSVNKNAIEAHLIL